MTASTQVLNGLCVDSAKPRGEAIELDLVVEATDALQAVRDFVPPGPLPTHGPPSLTHALRRVPIRRGPRFGRSEIEGAEAYL